MQWEAWGIEVEKGNGKEALVLVTAQPAKDTSRLPVVLNLVLDRSASMTGAALVAAVEAAQQFVHAAEPTDFVGLVAFDRVAEQVVPIVAMDERGKKAMARALSDLEVGSGTALHDALTIAASNVGRVMVPKARRKIFLLTDGEPSVGPERAEDFYALGSKIAGDGVVIHTLGLGRHYLPEILSATAQASGAGFSHADDPAGISTAMGGVLAEIFGEVANEVAVDVVPSGFHILTCKHAYEVKGIEDGLRVKIGSVSRGLPRRALFCGQVAQPNWEISITGAATSATGKSQSTIRVERVDPDSTQGRLIRAIAAELALVEAEASAWLGIARHDRDAANSALMVAELSLRDLVGLSVQEIASRRHLERLADLRLLIEKGKGDMSLLMRRAQEASVKTHISKVFQFPANKQKN